MTDNDSHRKRLYEALKNYTPGDSVYDVLGDQIAKALLEKMEEEE
tara:strand:- start:238 stop:372 length:135 start_codon:yes stop_codon:yes gene_type:complete